MVGSLWSMAATISSTWWIGMIGCDDRYLVVSCRVFAGILPNENIKPKQTALRSELSLFCQNYYEIGVGT